MAQQLDTLILVTGGTFDKEYDLINGQLYFKDTHLPDMFKRGRCTVPLTIRTLMMIDSLEMKDEDRNAIAYHCQRAEQRHILITHGTDTMCETAVQLAQASIEGKTIVLVGALIPYSLGHSSDGFFNIGAALAFSQVLNPGVYIAMHGRYFNWDNVKKNRQTGYFEELNP